ncbi:MAG: ABC transporter [Lachnospiraceae bacterium]|nr:ABC transporter [Lachnospiraceae bacterium]
MLAIYKKELKSYFTSMMGCIFVAACLIIASFFFCLYNLYLGYPNIYIGLQYVVTFFVVLMPVLTMRIVSEEQRNKTDQLLYTVPVSVTSIVMGKYLAMLTIFGIPVLVICTYPLILGQYGESSHAESYLAILAYFLIGATFIAIGMFISSITESQIIAAVVSFAVLLATQFMDSIATLISGTAVASLIGFIILIFILCLVYFLLAKNVLMYIGSLIVLIATTVILFFVKPEMFEGSINGLLKSLSITSMANDLFAYSILDITAIVYYITVIAFFVFITVQSIQKKRWN